MRPEQGGARGQARTSRCASPISPTGASPTSAARASTPATSPRPSLDLGHHVEVFSGQPYPIVDERSRRSTSCPASTSSTTPTPAGFPAYWEFKSWHDVVEVLQFSTGSFSEPLAFSLRALQGARAAARRLRPRARQPEPRLRHAAHRAAAAHRRHAAPPDLEGPGAGDVARAERPQAAPGGALVPVHPDAGARWPARCLASWSSARTRSATSTSTSASTRSACGSCP